MSGAHDPCECRSHSHAADHELLDVLDCGADHNGLAGSALRHEQRAHCGVLTTYNAGVGQILYEFVTSWYDGAPVSGAADNIQRDCVRALIEGDLSQRAISLGSNLIKNNLIGIPKFGHLIPDGSGGTHQALVYYDFNCNHCPHHRSVGLDPYPSLEQVHAL